MIKEQLKRITNFHMASSDLRDIITFTTARSGSTLVNEMIATQPGFKPIYRSLFDFRDPVAKRELARYGLHCWEDFYEETNLNKVANYINGFRKGEILSSDPLFFRNYWRLITRRIVCKALNAFEDQIEWFRNSLGFEIIYLIRHPIPVSLSRATLPRLELMLSSRYRENFNAQQLKLADDLFAHGTYMEKAVLDWSLQNAVCLRNRKPEWLLVSYEQLILDPNSVIQELSSSLHLQSPEKMLAQLFKPSRSTALSDAKTQKVLGCSGDSEQKQQDDQDRKSYLVERWREKVDRAEEERLMEIVQQFDIDAYLFDAVAPQEKYWIKHQS